MPKTTILILLLFIFGTRDYVFADSIPKYLKPVHNMIVGNWLMKNPKYIMVKDEDCGCEENINYLRKGTKNKIELIPDFHPYYAVGDFNGDDKVDFAIAVKKRQKKDKNLVILVFNGPFEKNKTKSPFVIKNHLLLGNSLFFFTKSESPKLLFGAFESEGCALIPMGKSYKVDCNVDY